jgi:hypothetical protein
MPVELFEDLKPEVFKSIIPGHIRGTLGKILSTPEWVEVVYLNFFNTSGVDINNLHLTMDVTMDIGLAAFQAESIPYTQRQGCKPIDSRFL